MTQQETLGKIADRVLESPWSTTLAAIIALATVILLYKLIQNVLSGSGTALSSVVSAFQQAFREVVGGKDVTAYERINGILIVGLLLLSAILLIVFSAQSIRGVAVGESPPLPVLGAFLLCMLLTSASGILCVRFCARHKADLEAVKSFRNRKV